MKIRRVSCEGQNIEHFISVILEFHLSFTFVDNILTAFAINCVLLLEKQSQNKVIAKKKSSANYVCFTFFSFHTFKLLLHI